MFEEIIFKKKLEYKSNNQKNKRISTLYNNNICLPLYNVNELSKSKNNKKENSLTIKPISRNHNNNIEALFFKGMPQKVTNSFFSLTASKKVNHNILKILNNKIKPFAHSNRNNKTHNQYFGRQKIDLIVRNYFKEKEKVFPWKNPFKDYKEPLFIYEILNSNKIDKENPIIPLSQRTYNSKLLYNLKGIKNTNLTKDRNIYLNSLTHKNEKLKFILNFKAIKNEEKRKLYDIEMRDTVEVPPRHIQKIRKLIYNYLTKESNIKEIIDNEIFYQSFENRVNFIYDGLKLPTIKNNLVKTYIDHKKEWKNLNAINAKTLISLNQLKLIIQRKRDQNKNKKKYSTKRMFLIDKVDNTIHFKDEDEDYGIEKLDKEYLYDCNKYFYEKTLNKKINITNNLFIKNCVFNKYSVIVEKEKTETII
jgi:hypothetical protein